MSVAISPSCISFLMTSGALSCSDSATSLTVEPERTGTAGSSAISASSLACASASRSGSTHWGRRLRPRPRRGGWDCWGGPGRSRREAWESMTTRRRRPPVSAPPPSPARPPRVGRAPPRPPPPTGSSGATPAALSTTGPRDRPGHRDRVHRRRHRALRPGADARRGVARPEGFVARARRDPHGAPRPRDPAASGSKGAAVRSPACLRPGCRRRRERPRRRGRWAPPPARAAPRRAAAGSAALGGAGDGAAPLPKARAASVSSTLDAGAVTLRPAPWSTWRASLEVIPRSFAIS